MAKIERLIEQARTQIGFGGDVLAAVAGVYEANSSSSSQRNGAFIATSEQLIFFAKKIIGYESESFAYDQILSVQVHKKLLGHCISFCLSSGARMQMKWISEGDAQKFARVVTTRATAAGDTPAAAHTRTVEQSGSTADDSASAGVGGTVVLVGFVLLGLWWSGFISFGRPDRGDKPEHAAAEQGGAEDSKVDKPQKQKAAPEPTMVEREAESAARAEAEASTRAAEKAKRAAQERRKKICEESQLVAYVMIQDAVRSRLRTPRSAEFPSFGSRGVVVTNEAGCSYGIAAYVDSQNGFGAMVRSAYLAKIRAHLDGTWTVEAVTVLE